jgi:DNA-binding NarL/FixJ family response regulator
MKILVVDDHVLIREALRNVLTQLKGDASILEASDCAQTMRLIEQHPDLDLIVLDLNLPDRDGFSVLAELRERYATTAVVVLSASHDRNKIKHALGLGAAGFIPKTTDREVMLNAFQLMFAGGTYIPKEILGGHMSSSRQLACGDQPSIQLELLADLGLTGRQVEVLGLMMQGKSNKAISHELNMAQPTVKSHITAIFKALKVANRTEAVIKVGRMGWDLSPTAES